MLFRSRVLQELAVRKSDKVLEVGTGTGYLTALLAHRSLHVVSIELDPQLKQMGEAALRAHGVENVTLEQGNGALGWTARAPYDVIVLTGSVPVLPDALLEQMKPGGRLFAVVGDAPVMKAQLVSCAGPGSYRSVDLFETCIPALQDAVQPERFHF